MTNATRALLLKTLAREISGAEDELARTEMACGRRPEGELYGASGHTCGALLAGAQGRLNDLRKALAEVEHKPHCVLCQATLTPANDATTRSGIHLCAKCA